MKHLRLYLVISSVILTAYSIFSSHNFFHSISQATKGMSIDWWLCIFCAIAVQLIGHWFRMLRTKTILDLVRKGRGIDQFGALSVGYLFNALLPLRLGELVRTVIIGRRLRISLLYTFAVIALERAIDLLFIGIAVVGASIFVSGGVARIIFLGAIGAIVIAIVTVIVLLLLVRENRFVLTRVWMLSGLLNVSLSNTFRFKVWSLIFGFQQFIRRKKAIRRYLVLSVLSWVCYLASMLILVITILAKTTIGASVLLFTAPYIAISTRLVPANLAHYTHAISPVIGAISGLLGTGVASYIILSWLVLTLPMMLIGYSALFWLKLKPSAQTRALSNEGFANKLLRREDVSQEFPAFLDTYFLGQNLSRILHKIEVAGELSLVKFFKGGSNAITMLALRGNNLFIKKIVPPEYRSRLRNQYVWLKKHKKFSGIVNVLGEQTTDNYYAIDIEYNPNTAAFFEYLHDRPLRDAVRVIDNSWKILYDKVYKLERLSKHMAQRDAYIKDRLDDKLDQAAAVHSDLKAAMQPKKIKINGEVYDNYHAVMKRIKKHPQAWKDIATYRASKAIHGDLTIDNILVDVTTEKPILIDPSDDNQIRGPIIDFGRQMQSLLAGYETLTYDDDPVEMQKEGDMAVIHYRNIRSARYMQLYDHVMKKIVPKHLSDAEQRSILFHVGLFYSRMLPHRVVIQPDNVLKFYAVSIRYLNDFINQYPKKA